MKFLFTTLALVLLVGCSVLNTFKGPNDFWRNYAAEEFKRDIDNDIQEEVRLDVPNGYKTKAYSREIWNEYWNDRINTLYDIGTTEGTKAYKGTSGPQFVSYIIQSRRANGLPELRIEDRNRDKVPTLVP